MSDEEERGKATTANLFSLKELNRIFSDRDEFGPTEVTSSTLKTISSTMPNNSTPEDEDDGKSSTKRLYVNLFE